MFLPHIKWKQIYIEAIEIAAQEQRSIKIPTIQTLPFMATRVKDNNIGVEMKLIENASYPKRNNRETQKSKQLNE